MIANELEDLRVWSAELLGWERVYSDGIPMWKLPDGRWDVINWQPDINLTQCFMVVEKMRELNWKMELNICARGQFPYNCWFIKNDGSYGNLPYGECIRDNLCEAILLAAKSAVSK